MGFSIIIRCLNEERHLPRLLDAVRLQTVQPDEVVVVDSGSTDNTVRIASQKGARVIHIEPKDFSFGRALNRGAAAARHEILVIASAHIYPTSERWLESLVKPFDDPSVGLVYGGQRGDHRTKFSEHRILQQWFPDDSCDDQRHPFCNNANSAVRRDIWAVMPYDEKMPGLEDIHWAKRALDRGFKIVYRADAAVIHVHEESHKQIYRRYRREAMGLQAISPGEHMGLFHTFGIWSRAVVSDLREASQKGLLRRAVWPVLCFRSAQYWGTYRGLNWRSPLTSDLKARLYYPKGYRLEAGDPAGSASQTGAQRMPVVREQKDLN